MIWLKSGSWFIIEYQLGCDPYLVVKCEGETVRSPVLKDTVSPTFNFSVLFYRKFPQKPIKVQVGVKYIKEKASLYLE